MEKRYRALVALFALLLTLLLACFITQHLPHLGAEAPPTPTVTILPTRTSVPTPIITIVPTHVLMKRPTPTPTWAAHTIGNG